MGSQTFEILRQGLWASFTGGWFFDPHQEIFCNTFHMYLWICLLLTPFVLYMTSSTVAIPMTLYPLAVGFFFGMIKFVNFKLHALFDGKETMNEVAKETASAKEPVQGTSGALDEDICVDLHNVNSSSAVLDHEVVDCGVVGHSSTSLKEEIDAALLSSNITNAETMGSNRFPIEAPPGTINADEEEELVLPGDPAVKIPCKVAVHFSLNKGSLRSVASPGSSDSGAEAFKIDMSSGADANDEDLVIANEPMVSDFETTPRISQQNDPSRSSPQQFPLNLYRLIEASSDSSWSSSLFSTDSEDQVRVPSVEFLPDNSATSKIKRPTHDKGLNTQDIAEAKSDTIIPVSKMAAEAMDLNVVSDKTLSMPVLQTKAVMSPEAVPVRSNSTGAHSKANQTVWFSLPEIENSSEALGHVHTESSCLKLAPASGADVVAHPSQSTASEAGLQYADAIYEDADKMAAVNHDVANSEDQDHVFSSDEKTRSLQRRQIQRIGAFRASAGDARHPPYLRLRSRTNSSSHETSLLHHDLGVAEALEGATDAADAKHIATSHDDTSAGAVHCFQDEFGQWYSYTFGHGSMVPISEPLVSSEPFLDALQGMLAGESSRSQQAGQQERAESVSSISAQQDLLSEMQELSHEFANSSSVSTQPWQGTTNPFFRTRYGGVLTVEVTQPVANKYYMLPILGSYSVKISFDRLSLLALLDRNRNIPQTIASVLLATLVGALGYLLLSRNYFLDFWIFTMCFVIAKCQFSLLKSVQPDSASPVHGHNNTIVFSRSIYFCVVSSLALILDEAAKLRPVSQPLYGVHVYTEETLMFARDMLLGFLLGFPVIFLVGLLPQINTFAMHVFEQLDMHLFGGSAMTSLSTSVYAVIRSTVAVCVLYGFPFCALKQSLSSEVAGQHLMFSVFAGLLVALSYHLSRSTSDPSVLVQIIKAKVSCLVKRPVSNVKKDDKEENDPLPEKLMNTVCTRLMHDSITCVFIAVIVFAVHVSTVFTTLQPTLSYSLYSITGAVGVVNHYVLPQLRKQLPWLFISSPVLKSYEYHLFDWQEPSRIRWFERVYVWIGVIEKNILYPVTFLSALTMHAAAISDKFGPHIGALVITITGLKMLRLGFSNTARQHITLIWTALFFNFDYEGYSETFPIDYFLMSIFVEKVYELYQKLKFILTYTAPWQITWGSAFHAFAQPFSVPHCGMLFCQALISAFCSAPLNPFLGSAIFITSYVRPVKFWEKNYNTKRVDHSNTRLSSHIDSNPGADDNNLNSIFYEHLTRSLQHSLCGDLYLGRWGNYASGDCYVMASDYLNALVHIIEVGNGYVTFQLRGLEFRGTYCQQREVEAITEGVEDDAGCCCCSLGHLPNLLSLNATFTQRWLAWEVVQSKYILEGYSVSDNTATTMFQMFDLRKIFITYYVKSIVFFCVRNKKLEAWLTDDNLMGQLTELNNPSYVDLDPIFRPFTDEDYVMGSGGGGVSRSSFTNTYHKWIAYCNKQRRSKRIENDGKSSPLTTLCFALSLLGRRLLSAASHHQTTTLKSFLYGLHALFKGDFRVTAAKDEWVFAEPDMELLRMVVAPAVRMGVKLHQDHFTCVDEYDDNDTLYQTISSHEEQFVICHEGHPQWRQAVLNSRPNLLAFRYVIDEGSDDYKIIMLNKRYLNFRVIKINKECVRGLWAGQLQELIFLRNRNPERGSIQNAKQALRNMINSSCDQPIGYPIYVSPLTTSFADTNAQLSGISLGNLSAVAIRNFFSRIYRGLVEQYTGHCSGQRGEQELELEMMSRQSDSVGTASRISKGLGSSSGKTASSASCRANSYTSIPSSSNPSTSASESSQAEVSATPVLAVEGRARLVDISRVLDALSVIKTARDIVWPSLWLREKARRTGWDGWYPQAGMIGDILYHWEPGHEDPSRAIASDKKIFLLKVEGYVVPVVESGIIVLDESHQEIEV